ncbi:PAS domain-containing protein, partial [Candidatus Collierbacteria bacterium]|nr:PAS domain-containing protein [Candidatus Collierbacteria bacterium]
HFGEKNIAILATAPIVDQDRLEHSSDQQKSENIGVIMLFFKTDGLSNILTGKAQTEFGALSTWTVRKKTMEVYLVNQDKVMVSESKFVLNAPFKQTVDTPPVRLCAKSEEMVGEYLSYRQIPVFGASMCFGNGWTLLTEIDKDEVLGSLGDYLQQNLLSGMATFLLILIAMYLFTIGITTPLKELSGVAQKLGKGDFTTRSKLLTRDEFGELSQVFNQMAENVQKGNAGLAEKVKEEETGRLAIGNILGDLEVAKNQLEAEKAKDEAILASIGDAVMACDKDGRIMLFNGVAQALTGFSSKEVTGNHYRQILHFIKESDQKPGNDFIAEAIATGQGTKMANHTLLITKDGRKIPVADSAAPIKNAQGEIIGCVVVFRDFTHERDVDRAKTEFVSLASHQLRTPLTSINWYIEMLQAGDAGALNDKQKEFLSEVYKGSKRMVQLVNDLLNVSRLETGRLKIGPVMTDLAVFIAEVKKELEPQIQEQGCLVTLELPQKTIAKIPVNPVLLRQVIVNFLTNAIRYSSKDKKGAVTVSLIVSPQKYTIQVKDNGIGIPQDVQPHIFEKFFRADNARAIVADGNGLGLYLAKQIMESSGGTIGFSSSVGSGSTFYATIPLSGMRAKVGEKGIEI